MPATQPGQPVPVSHAAPERLIAQWTEPTEQLQVGGQLPLRYVVIGAVAITAVFVTVGILIKDFTYYMAAAASLAAGSAVVAQRRTPPRGRDVVLGSQSLQVGRQTHSLADMAGFWLESAGEAAAVNVEPKKAAMMPITFLYPGSPAEARQTLLEVLPELEPRQPGWGDALSRYIRL